MLALVDMIYIYEDKKVKIAFKYQNPFKDALEYIENNKEVLDKDTVDALLGV